MITQLPISLTAMAGEPGFSLLARLANANTGRSTHDFCVSTGLSKSAICSGETKALEELARLTGSDRTELRKNSPRVIDRKFTILSGCKFQSRSIRKQDMVVCPICWAEQINSGVDKPYSVAIRREWLPRPISTCLLHEVRLIELPFWDYTTTYDHLRRSKLDRGWAVDLLDRTQERNPSTFEQLTVRQLETGRPVCTWLPSEQIDVLEKWCFGLGLLLEKGSTHANATQKSDENLYIERGLQAIMPGKEHMLQEIDTALRRHRLRLPSTWLAGWSGQSQKPRERQHFAKLFKSLVDDQGHFCLSSVTDQLPREIEFEMGLKSIAKSTRCSPAKVRELLARDGLIPLNGLPHQQSIYMVLRHCRDHLGAVDQSLSEPRAADVLGVGSHLFKGLVRDNVIAPMKTKIYRTARYDIAILEAVRDKFLGQAKAEDGAAEMLSLKDVCFLLRCPASRVLSKLSSGQLPSTNLISNAVGLDRLRFDLGEIKNSFAKNEAGGLTVEELRSILGLQHRHVTKLAKLGLLPNYKGRKKDTAISAALVDQSTLDEFLRTYQTARTWCKKTGQSERAVRSLLKYGSLKRAREGDGIPIYRVDDILRL